MSWPMVALGELMAVRTPSIDPAKYPDEEFELWSIPAFDAGAPEMALGIEIGSAKKVVEPNDVLLSRIVPHIRRSWVVASPSARRRQIASGEWIIFRSKRIYPAYLRHVLQGDTFHTAFMGTVAGVGGHPLLSSDDRVPPSSEQRRIAAILDQADALRRLRRQSLSRLSDLGQAVFFEMFGDPIQNPREWPVGSVRDIISEAKYGTAQKANTTCAGIPILRMGNLTYDGRIDLSDLKHVELAERDIPKYTTRRSDLLFNRTNSK